MLRSIQLAARRPGLRASARRAASVWRLAPICGSLLLAGAAPAAAQSPCEDMRLDINGDGVVNNVDQGICFGCKPDSDDGCWEDCWLWDLDEDDIVGFSDVGRITLDCPKWGEKFVPLKPRPAAEPTQSPTATPDATPSDTAADPTQTPLTPTATPESTPPATWTPSRTREAAATATPAVTPAPPPPPPSGSGWLFWVGLVAALAALGVLAYIRWWRARWL